MTRHNRAPASNLNLRPLPKLRPLARMIAGLSAMSMALPALAIDEHALPQHGEVTHGSATISRQGSNMGIQQNSARTVIDWQSFDIGSEAGVNFNQPDAASIAVNRINNSASPSEIHGNLQANGQVWLLNPNGVMFGATAQVDVAGLLATSARLNTAEFMAGNTRLEFEGGNRGSIINEGDISIREGGLAAFVAPTVQNSGRIHAYLGKVSLAAGDTFTLDLAGDGLLELGLSAGEQARVEQLGEVVASGGVIEIATGAASAVVDDIINLSGYTSAASAEVVGGDIILSGGDVQIAGTVDASGVGGGGQVDIRADNITTTANADLRADALGNGDGGVIYAYADSHGDYNGNFSARGGESGGNGGFIETSGNQVRIDDSISVNTLATRGKAGNWTIDPDDLTVIDGLDAGSWNDSQSTVTNSTIETLMDTTGITLTANNSITVEADINTNTQTSSTTLALNDENSDDNLTINLNAAITLGTNQSLSGQGTTINVSDSALIQNGIDVAASGADVNVAAGTYAEDLVIDKSLQLVGAGANATTIQGQGGGQTAAVNISADNVTLGGADADEGFRIEGAGLRAVYLNEDVSGATIQNNTIVAAEDKLALDSTGSQSNHTIQSNTFTAAGSGTNKQLVYINGAASLGSERASSGVDILNNTFEGSAQLALGMEAGNSLIEGNTFEGSNSYAAIELWEVPDSLSGNSFATDTAAHLRLSANASTGALDYGLLTDILDNNDFATAVLNTASTGNVNEGESATVFGRIQSAADAASAGDVLNIASGNYGQTVIDKNLSITGIGTKPVIKPNDDFTGTNATGAWILVDERVDFSLSNLVLDGDSYQINQALRSHGNTNISNVDFRNIQGSHIYSGIALASYGGTVGGGGGSDSHGGSGLSASHLTVTDSSFDNIGRISVLIKGDGATADISGSTFTGKGGGDFLDYAIEVGAGGNANITDNIISGNRGQASSDGSTSAGILITTYYGVGSQATLTDNHISDSTAAVAIGYDDSDSSTVNANGNTFTDTDTALKLTSLNLTTNIENNTFSSNNVQLFNTESGFDVDPILNGNNFDRAVVVRDGESIAASGIFSLIQDGINAAATNNTVDVLAGIYDGDININKTGIQLIGTDATVQTTATNRGFIINADDVSINGFTINGVLDVPYYSKTDWDTGATAEDKLSGNHGIFVNGSYTGFNIAGNTITNVRSAISTGVGASGTISGNLIDNTKGSVLAQDNGDLLNISGNFIGSTGNEWDIVLNLNNISIASAADAARQGKILAFSTSNNGMTVLDRGYGSSNRSHVMVDAASTVTDANDFGYGNGLGNLRQPLQSITDGVNAVIAGGIINIADGAYSLASTLNINKHLTLIGESQAGTVISAATSGYGIHVTADDVSLSDFTLNGPSADAGSSYGIKVNPTGGDPSARLNNFSIADVTIQGSGRAELDLNGVTGATITNVTADGQNTAGAGIQLTDSADITLTGVTTLNNLWGGVALYQSNRYFDQQTTNINIDANDNTFNEPNGLFAQDESDGTGTSVVGDTGLDFGVVNLTGFTHIVENNDFRNGGNGHPDDGIGEEFTFFRTSLADAFEFAVNLNDTVIASSTVQGWTGSDVDNNFHVGNHGGNTMSIQAAINAADDGNTINVLAGTYNEALEITRNIDINGAGVDQTIIRPDTLVETGVDHKYTTNMKVTVFVNGADDVSLSGMTIDGNNLDGNAVVFWTNSSGTIEDVLIKNPRPFSGMQTGQGLAVDATGSNTTDLLVSNVSFENWNKNAIDVVNGQGAGSGGGDVNLTVLNSTFNGRGPTNTIAQNAIVLWERAGGTITAIIDGADIANIEYINDPTWSASGILLYGSPNGELTIRNSSFANTIHAIGVAGGSPLEVDATEGNVFNGVAVADATLDELFEIENLLLHKTDDASNGLIRLEEDTVFVTDEKGSIQAGIDAASSGNTVQVEAGTYTETLQISGTDNLNIQGQDGALIDAGNITGNNRIVDLRADGTTFNGFDIIGPGAGAGINVGISISGQNNVVTNNTISDVLTGIQTTTMHAVGNALISGNTVNADHGISLQNNDNNVSNNKVTAAVEGVGLLVNGNTFTDNLFNIDADAEALVFYGSSDASGLLATANTVNLSGGSSLQEAVDLAGTDGTLTLGSGAYTGTALAADTLTLSADSALVEGLTLSSGGSISGSFSSSQEGFNFAGPLSLSDDLSLTTTGTAIINTADINGTVAGEQSLTINAEGEVSLGSLGETTSLGTTLISSNDTTLNGNSYNATSLEFSGPVTLTSADTLFNADQGDISFNGNIFGSSPGEQSITFSAGDGLDANSGDVILQNLGTEALKLGDLNVTASDFSAATVWLAGDFNSVLSGDQVFTDQTLNADGNVSSQVSGNASGPINSQGSVALAIMGAFSGNVSGSNVTLSARSIEAIINAIESASVSAAESYSGSISAASIVLAATTVDAELSGGTATVDAQNGNIRGNIENLTIANDDGGNFQVDVPNYTPPVTEPPVGQPPINRDEINFQQFYSQSFQNPDSEGSAFADNRPVAETLASNTVTVAGIDNLPGLLSEGNGAILIDLSPGYASEEEESD